MRSVEHRWSPHVWTPGTPLPIVLTMIECAKRCETSWLIFLILLIGVSGCLAQTPVGAIAGVVKDPRGSLLPSAKITVLHRVTGLSREVKSNEQGGYSAAALAAGTYELTAAAPGFKGLVREALVEAGFTTTVDLMMTVGDVAESITVEGAAPQIHYDTHTVGGIVTRGRIEGLPLNGRSFLELARFEPGVQAPLRASGNRTMLPVLGSPVRNTGSATRVTVDGGSIVQVGWSGSGMGFSQEVVQEFQIATIGFDLSTGITGSGAVNVVTRAGSNQLHGDGFFFFRDHKLAAYPVLRRSAFNPDPFFQRRQFGGSLGGPVRKDRAFFFGAYERNEQRAVFGTELLTPDFAPLSGINQTPSFNNQYSVRFDSRLNDWHTAFLRHSHDGARAVAPTFPNLASASSYPSNWTRQTAWVDQSVLGLTSVLRSNVVNDLRFSYFFASAADLAPTEQECPRCVGIGAPQISVPNAALTIGKSSTFHVLGRRWHLNDAIAWQKGAHRIRFGGEWEYTRGGRTDVNDEPVTITLFSPQEVRNYNARPATPAELRVPLPASFLTLSEILQLPIRAVTVGIGDARTPQKDFGHTRVAHTVHLFYQDTWRFHPRVTFNYGLAWTHEIPLNYDLPKPPFLGPILGVEGLGPTRKNWTNFSPLAGLAWSPMSDGKTVIRAGAGIYYDFLALNLMADPERVALLPRGTGRSSYPGTSIANPSANIPGVAQGAALDFANPSLFTGARLMELLPGIRAGLVRQRGDPNNRDFSVTNIEADKQGLVFPQSVPQHYSIHVNAGIQRELAQGLVLSADFAYRRFLRNGSGFPDMNRWNRRPLGPVIPACNSERRSDPKALCSLGPINVQSNFGRATYKGLLVRADKRLSKGFQFLWSYAYSSNVGLGVGVPSNLDNYFENYGPLDRDVRHILNVSGIVQLPKRFQLGFGVTYSSRSPFQVQLNGLDLNGDGTSNDLLPGTSGRRINHDLTQNELRTLVERFNQDWAGRPDAFGTFISPVRLPDSFEFDDSLFTQDLRVSRAFTLREQWKLTFVGEVFNLLNISNLTGHSNNLRGAGFGQPTGRITQVFGSGGPRAFQLAVRVSF